MPSGYKLTDENNRTCNNTQWGENVTHTATGTGNLCSNGWIHLYDDDLLAVLLNPIHASFSNPHLWTCEWTGATKSNGLKRGAERVTTLTRADLPAITTGQRVTFGILCAASITADEEWREWATKWLRDVDRSEAAAWAAGRAAVWAAAWAAAWAARGAAEAAAWAAAWAAEAAAWTAEADIDILSLVRLALQNSTELPPVILPAQPRD